MTAANSPITSSVESERRAHEPSMEEILASIRKIIADDDALPLTRPSAPPRLFEANVTQFSPPPAPREPAPQPAPAATRPEPPPVPPAPPVEAVAPASEPPRAEARLDASELASFAEVGRELSRLDTPEEPAPPAPVGQADETEVGLRPALDAADEVAAHLSDMAADADVSPVPHEDFEDVEEEPVETPEPPRFTEAREQPAFVFGANREAIPDRSEPATMLSAEANATVASAFQALSASVQLASAESIDRHVREMLRPMLKQWLDDNLPVMVERMVRAEIERVARGGR